MDPGPSGAIKTSQTIALWRGGFGWFLRIGMFVTPFPLKVSFVNHLFADTKTRENLAQNILDAHCPGNLAERPGGEAFASNSIKWGDYCTLKLSLRLSYHLLSETKMEKASKAKHYQSLIKRNLRITIDQVS